MSASNAWFTPYNSNLCTSPENSPVDSRQLSCRHLMVCLQLCQESAFRAAAYHHSSRLCILSGTELLSPCLSPGYKTCINPGQDIESTHLTDATTTVEATKAGPAHAVVALQIIDTSDKRDFYPVPLVGWYIIRYIGVKDIALKLSLVKMPARTCRVKSQHMGNKMLGIRGWHWRFVVSEKEKLFVWRVGMQILYCWWYTLSEIIMISDLIYSMMVRKTELWCGYTWVAYR